MNRKTLGDGLEKVLVHIFRLGVIFAKRIHWLGISQRIRNAWWRARLKHLGEGSNIHPHVIIHSPEMVSIGARCAVDEFVQIWGGGGVTMGDDVVIGAHAVISSLEHDTRLGIVMRATTWRRPVHIEDRGVLGSAAIVLPGVTIGCDSFVSAGSVIKNDVPPGQLVFANPGDRNVKLVPKKKVEE
ncbi:MAG: acyltransferase [Panacagrimonas sp.]